MYAICILLHSIFVVPAKLLLKYILLRNTFKALSTLWYNSYTSKELHTGWMWSTVSATGIVYLQVELNSLNSEEQHKSNVTYVKSGHLASTCTLKDNSTGNYF